MKKVAVPKAVLFVCAFLLVVVGFTFGYKCAESLQEDDKCRSDDYGYNTPPAPVEESYPKDINDTAIQTILDEKILSLKEIGLAEIENKSFIFSQDTINKDDILEMKRIVALINFTKDKNKTKISCAELKEVNSELFSDCNSEGDDVETPYLVLDALKVNEDYKTLYGESIKDYNIDSKMMGLISQEIYYNANSSKYIVVVNGEVKDTSRAITYNYKYVENKDTVDVYVALGMLEGTTLYTDYEGMNLYKEIEAGTLDKDIISASNYKDFSKYKITLKKNGNDYNFQNISKLA